MSDSDPLDSYERHYCLRWKYHHSNLQSMFAELLEEESFCDVTLACEGRTIRAHKLMLSASSPYFYALFSQYEETEPIVILKDVKYSDIKTLIDFMYKGEIQVENSQLNSVLQTAKELQIKCLAAVSWLYEDGTLRRIESNQATLNNQNKVFSLNKQVATAVKRKTEENSNIPSKVSCIPKETAAVDNLHNTVDEKSEKEEKLENVKNIESGAAEDKEQLTLKDSSELIPDEMCTTYLTEDDKSFSPDEKPPTTKKNISKNGGMKRFKDILTMTQYIQQGGKRPNFWDIDSTRCVMEAIKNKEMEMKKAAIMLGVSYGTLYGRYRDCYGYLKHPYRVREFWLEPDSINIISQITRKEISLFKGAEMLNVSATSLANYLATLNHDLDEVEDCKEKESVKPIIKNEKSDSETEDEITKVMDTSMT